MSFVRYAVIPMGTNESPAPTTEGTLPPLRRVAVDIALSYAGLSAAPPTRDQYAALLAWGCSPQRSRDICAESSCGRTAHAWLRAVLLAAGMAEHDLPEVLRRPSPDGAVMREVYRLAADARAIRSTVRAVEPADLVHLAGNAVASEHIYIVTGTTECPQGQAIESIDGGQVIVRDNASYQGILSRKRTLVSTAHGTEDRLLGGPTRHVWYICNFDALMGRLLG